MRYFRVLVGGALPVVVAAALIVLPSRSIADSAVRAPDSGVSQASPAGGTCRPLDLVLVIDQSTSMTYTDKANLRIDAARAIVDRLFLNAALRCPGVQHTISVLGFGTNLVTMLEPTPIRVDDITNQEWLLESERIKADLRPLDLGLTDFGRAFLDPDQGAGVLLNKAREINPGTGHVSAIIVVTDGMPCTAKAHDKEYCGSPTWVRQYFFADQRSVFDPENAEDDGYPPRGLSGELNRAFPAVPNGTTINVLLFADRSQIFPVVDEAWELITRPRDGRYIPPERISSLPKITAELEQMLDPLLGVSTTPVVCDEPFYLEPYASSTTIISAIRPDSNLRVTILDPDGKAISDFNVIQNDPNIDYFQLQSIERYVIVNPKPGAWRIIGPPELCDKIEASYETIQLTSRFTLVPTDIVVNLDPPYYTASSDKYAQFTLVNSRGEPFSPDPAYPLIICGTVSTSLGVAQKVLSGLPCITFSEQLPDHPGVWRSDTPLPAPRQGTYTLQVTGKVSSIVPGSDKMLDIFAIEASYQTAPPVSVALHPRAPQPGQVLPLNKLNGAERSNQPFEVAVQIEQSGGGLVEVAQVFRGSLISQAVQATLVDASGTVLETITLVPAAEDVFSLVGTFRSGVSALDPPGNYQVGFALTPAAQSGYNTDNYVFSTFTSDLVTFERRELKGVQFIARDVPGQIALNDIQNGQAVPLPFTVELRLADQDGGPLAVSDVFGADAMQNGVLEAVLVGPDGNAIETVMLTPLPDLPDVVGATFRQGATKIDPAGTYVIRFALPADVVYDASRYAFFSPVADALRVERMPLTGVNVVALAPASDDVLYVNEIDIPRRLQFPVPIDVHAALCDLDGNRLHDLADFIDVSASDVVEAVLVGPDGRVIERKWLALQADGTFRGTLRAGTETIDMPGVYSVSFAVNTDRMLATPRYELVSATTPPVAFQREKRLAVQLKLVRLGNVDPAQEAQVQRAVRVPLYPSILDAILRREQPLLIEFVLEDLDGVHPSWKTLVAEPSVTPLDVLVRISLITPSSSAPMIPIGLREYADGEGGFVLRGEISAEGAQSGVYTINYELNVQALAPGVIGLVGEHNSYTFERTITDRLRDPGLWRIVEIALAAMLGLSVLRVIYINTFRRMYGVLQVIYAIDVEEPIAISIPLGGIRWRLARYGSGKGLHNDGKAERVKVKVTVRRASAIESTSGSPFDGTRSEPVMGEIRRVYHVEVYPKHGEPQVEDVAEGQSVFGSLSIQHTLFEQ